MDAISYHTMLMPEATEFGPPLGLDGLLEQYPSMTEDQLSTSREGIARKYEISNRSAFLNNHYKASRIYDCVHYKSSD